MMSPQLDFFGKVLSLLTGVLGGEAPLIRGEFTDLPDASSLSLEACQSSLVVSRSPDGSLRRENPHSGVVHEEHADGSLTVSLPHGKVLCQCYEGAPLLVVDFDDPEPSKAPLLARVMTALIDQQASLVYHYEDPDEGHYVIEIASLRHFHSRRPPVTVPEGAPAAGEWAWV